ncbi:unnamed protein product [Moneuplotes crassus]|uniref:Uncharacterized protein n=1 Tax=Euplotes crassus TaxID=5936 RepID=A0AAD2D8K4_EUPCR|nr:unnamed protein product [Moneuplotes crassus]
MLQNISIMNHQLSQIPRLNSCYRQSRNEPSSWTSWDGLTQELEELCLEPKSVRLLATAVKYVPDFRVQNRKARCLAELINNSSKGQIMVRGINYCNLQRAKF